MNFPTSVKSGFNNYANFKGRASRSEFWWFILFSQLLQMLAQEVSDPTAQIVWLVLFLPGLSIQIRRLHDIGRSSKWLIWLAVSVVGVALALVGLLMQTSQAIADVDAKLLFDNGSQVWIFGLFVFTISVIFSGIVNFVFLLMPSNAEMNKYGPPPPPAI